MFSPAWKQRGPILISALHKFVTYLLRHLPTYLQARTHTCEVTLCCPQLLLGWLSMYVSFGQGSSLLWTHTLRPFYSRPIALTQEGRSLVNVCMTEG